MNGIEIKPDVQVFSFALREELVQYDFGQIGVERPESVEVVFDRAVVDDAVVESIEQQVEQGQVGFGSFVSGILDKLFWIWFSNRIL